MALRLITWSLGSSVLYTFHLPQSRDDCIIITKHESRHVTITDNQPKKQA